jgi:hypothetical protein
MDAAKVVYRCPQCGRLKAVDADAHGPLCWNHKESVKMSLDSDKAKNPKEEMQ